MNPTPDPSPSALRKGRLIVAFAALYLAIQVTLIVICQFTPSKHFGFWMFPESTYYQAKLVRVLADGREVAVPKGTWTVEDDSKRIQYKWSSFVKGYRLNLLDQKVRSKGTFADTTKYMQGAVDFVAANIPRDKITDQIVLRVRYHRAGQPEQTLMFRSKSRLGNTLYGSTRS